MSDDGLRTIKPPPLVRQGVNGPLQFGHYWEPDIFELGDVRCIGLVDLQAAYASLDPTSQEPGQLHRTGLWRPDDIREPMVRLHAEHLAEHGRASPKGGHDG